MTGEVLAFTGVTTVPDDPTDTLEKAKLWGLGRVVICGFKEDGDFVFGGSHSEIGESLLLLEMAKRELLAAVVGDA